MDLKEIIVNNHHFCTSADLGKRTEKEFIESIIMRKTSKKVYQVSKNRKRQRFQWGQ